MNEGDLFKHQLFLIKAVLIVGSGGFIFGYDIGVISGTLSKLKDQFGLDEFEQGLVVSILYVGSILGSIFGGPMCDTIGRWKTIQIQNGIFILGSLITGLATNVYLLCLGRFLVGIASAISGLADVPYLMEVAAEEYRGIISGQYEILVAMGILASFALDLLFISQLPDETGWRWAFILPSFIVLFQSAGMFSLPESPKWLFAKQHRVATKTALLEIYGNEIKVDKVMQDLEDECIYSFLTGEEEESTSSESTSAQKKNMIITNPITLHLPITSDSTRDDYGSTNEVIEPLQLLPNNSTSPVAAAAAPTACLQKVSIWLTPQERQLFDKYLPVITFIFCIQGLSQITGSNVIRNYAPILFEQTGVTPTTSLLYNLILGMVKLLFTILAVSRIESYGRKALFLFGISLVTLGMLILTLASFFHGYTSSSHDYNLQDTWSFMISCVLIYMGFGFGYGPITWIISSEMIPTIIRSRILSYSLIMCNAAQCLMNFLFLPLISVIDTMGMFGIFFVLNVFTAWYVYRYLIESKELLPDEILKRFEKNRLYRNSPGYGHSHGSSDGEEGSRGDKVYEQLDTQSTHHSHPHSIATQEGDGDDV